MLARDIFSASLEKMEIHTITIIQHCDYYISIMDEVWTEKFLEEYLSLRIALWSSCSGKKIAVRCF